MSTSLLGLCLAPFIIVLSFDTTSGLLSGNTNNTHLLAPVTGLLDPIAPGLAKAVDKVGSAVDKAVDRVGRILPEILDFAAFILHFGRKYPSLKEKQKREKIYNDNIKFIQETNARESNGQLTHRLGINEYADLTQEEWSKKNGFNRKTSPSTDPVSQPQAPGIEGLLERRRRKRGTTIATTVDWRTQGYVTDVQDQGDCGSCYAFAATAAVEGQYAKTYGKLVNLSEQTIVACSETSYWNLGCDGGDTDYVFEYMGRNGTLTEDQCPYNATYIGSDCCPKVSYEGVGRVRRYVDLPYGNETALKQAVATVGPIASAFNASSKQFQLYRSGVLDTRYCKSTDDADHAIAVVGYGTNNGTDFWIIKNSWGLSWGQRGYALIARNTGNRCAIASYASYPILY